MSRFTDKHEDAFAVNYGGNYYGGLGCALGWENNEQILAMLGSGAAIVTPGTCIGYSMRPVGFPNPAILPVPVATPQQRSSSVIKFVSRVGNSLIWEGPYPLFLDAGKKTLYDGDEITYEGKKMRCKYTQGDLKIGNIVQMTMMPVNGSGAAANNNEGDKYVLKNGEFRFSKGTTGAPDMFNNVIIQHNDIVFYQDKEWLVLDMGNEWRLRLVKRNISSHVTQRGDMVIMKNDIHVSNSGNKSVKVAGVNFSFKNLVDGEFVCFHGVNYAVMEETDKYTLIRQ